MSFLKKSVDVALVDIKVNRAGRQRRELDLGHIKELGESMKARGLIHPIVLDKDNQLVVGECRLEAAKLIGWDSIPCRFNNTEDSDEKQIIELEENLRRANLSWQDRARAIVAVDLAFKRIDDNWTDQKTGDAINFSPEKVAQARGLVREMEAGNKAVIGAKKQSEALTAITRGRAKAFESISKEVFTPAKTKAEPRADGKAQPPEPRKEIIVADFLDWSKTMQENRADFIHCDFPYGVNLNKSGQMSTAFQKYADEPDVYWDLLEGFVKNYSNFAQPISHIMFWFSMKFYTQTVEALRAIPQSLVRPHPLVWVKSDNKGIVPDHLRGPRQIYETALIVSVGDRKIRELASNASYQPTDAARGHPSRKPIPVLQTFFPMFVDKDTLLLDPTCGSGSALQCAKAMGAQVLGIERDAEFAGGIEL